MINYCTPNIQCFLAEKNPWPSIDKTIGWMWCLLIRMLWDFCLKLNMTSLWQHSCLIQKIGPDLSLSLQLLFSIEFYPFVKKWIEKNIKTFENLFTWYVRELIAALKILLYQSPQAQMRVTHSTTVPYQSPVWHTSASRPRA